ncbi:hypothetical protein MRX96_012183 [Rhipicephalus microplus]
MASVDPGADAQAKQQSAAQASLQALSSEAFSAFHESPPWEGRRRDRYYTFAAVFIALAVFAWAFLSLTADRTDAAPYTEQRFCCSHLLATLAEVSNLSLAPCNSFFDFACFRRTGIERLNITLKNLLSDVVSPVLHGIAREPVSDVLRLFHAGCTRTAVDTGLTLAEAVRDFIATLRLRVPVPSTDMLTLLGGLATPATDGAMRVLEALIAPERSAVAMAYLVLRAMEGLYELAFLTAAHPPESSANGQYCDEKTESLRALWAMATFERLKSPRRNVYLSQKVKHMLQDLKLQPFPDDVDEVAADMEKLPEMTPVYWTNVLAVRSHTQRLVLKRASIDAGSWWTLDRGLYEVNASVRGDALYVSGALYSMLPSKNDSDVFVNIALVGAHVANALWRQVFLLNSVSQRSRESLARFKTCAINRLGERATGLEFAMLAIHSAAEGAKSAGWHDRVVPWGTTTFSASQVFYMTYFVSNVCAFQAWNDRVQRHSAPRALVHAASARFCSGLRVQRTRTVSR